MARANEKATAQGSRDLNLTFMAFKRAEANSPGWPPDKNAIPGRALVEETAEYDQRGKLQKRGLPIGGQALQESTGGQVMPIADRCLCVRRQSLVFEPPPSKTLRGDADGRKREQDDRE
jgi:hypothetical protein